MAKGYNLEQTGPQVQEAINKSLNLTTATQSKEGLMSAQDKQKLDSLDSELAGKVDKVPGKGLSTNDYDNTEKGKVASAYQKPVGGIPASDLAEGVIPDTSQFITKTVNDLANYYLKTETYSRSETYNKTEVDALIALIKQFTYQVVSELPEASESTMYKLYLVPSADPQTQNVKDEYITVRSGSEGAYTYAWEQIGSTAIDLSGYVTTQALNAALANYTTTANLTTLLAAKQDVIADLSTIRSGAAAGATAYQKPGTGIPKTDLESGVQQSLDLADSAIQAEPTGVDVPVEPSLYATKEEVDELEAKVDGNELALFNEGKLSAKFIPNEYVNNTNGGFLPYNGWSRTDYINILPFASIKITAAHSSNYCYIYGEDKTPRRQFSIGIGETVLAFAEGDYYICLSDATAQITQIVIEIDKYSFGAEGISIICGTADGKAHINTIEKTIDFGSGASVAYGTKVIEITNPYISLNGPQSGFSAVLLNPSTGAISYESAINSVAKKRTHILLGTINKVGRTSGEFYRFKSADFPCEVTVDGKVCGEDAILGKVDAKIGVLPFSKFNKGNLSWETIRGKYIDENTGEEVAFSGWSCSDYINVGLFSEIVIRAEHQSRYGAIFDENKVRIAGLVLSASDNTITLPDNACFIRFSDDNTNYDNITVSVSRYTKDALQKTGILDVNDKVKIENYLVQQNWSSRDGGSTPHTHPLVMLWFTDIHGSSYNFNRIVDFKRAFASKIQSSLCTGDVVSGTYQDDFSFWNDDDIMISIGNHDVIDQSTLEFSHKGIDAYNRYIKPFVANWGVVQPQNAETLGLCYYYKDYTANKVRLIVLDVMSWDSVQSLWLQGVLQDALENNLSVIIAQHYPPNNYAYERGCSFCTLYEHTSVVGMPGGIPNRVSDFINNGGEFICHLTGHMHIDYYGKIGTTGQLCFTLDCAYYQSDAWNDSDRVVNTKSADCFNILSIDTYDKTLKLFRVGVDRDRWLRHKGTMCVRYTTGELLYND